MYNYYVLIMSDIYSQVWLNENKYIDRLRKLKIDLSSNKLSWDLPLALKVGVKYKRNN